MNKNLVIVFCKNLLLGKVKTRLANSIGKTSALKVYKLLVGKTISVLKEIEEDVVVFHSDFVPNNKYWSFTKHQKIQLGNNLGNRMKNAFKWGFKMNYKNICIVGTDLWSIEKKIFKKTFQSLKKNDVVFGPALDGGYYLLGLKKLNISIFNIKSWSSSKVLEDSLNQIDCNDSVFFLPELNDIDTKEDLDKHKDLIERI
jgi:hypothetical protein